MKAFFLFFNTLSTLGHGLVFEWIYFVVVLVGLVVASAAFFRKPSLSYFNLLALPQAWIWVSYGAQTVGVVVLLFAANKMPIGESRLICFLTPGLIFLAIAGIEKLFGNLSFYNVIFPVLIIASTAAIFQSNASILFKQDYIFDIEIYKNLRSGISFAQSKSLPILATNEISGRRFSEELLITDWVVKTNPSYSATLKLPVYPVGYKQHLFDCMKRNGIEQAILIEGYSYNLVAIHDGKLVYPK